MDFDMQQNRQKWISILEETYSVSAEFPWASDPEYAVFRHRENQKWFALMMTVSKKKLGRNESGELLILNVKCDPLLIGSLRMQAGFYPAYHMNKTHWITIALDGTVAEETVLSLVEDSFVRTGKRYTINRSGTQKP